jgi:hypothetical protein
MQSAPIDPELVSRSLAAMLETVDKFAQRYVAGKAADIGADDKTAQDFGKAVALSGEAKSLMSSTLPIILQKHGVNADAAPEIAFVSGLGMYAAGLFTTISRLEKLAKERKQQPPKKDEKNDSVQNKA